VLVAAVVLVAGELLMRSPLIQGLVRGTTAISLMADTDSALYQQLELGRARLAHELRSGEIGFESIEVAGSGTSATIEIVGVRPSASKRVDAILRRLFPGWTIDTSPSGSLRVSPGVEVRAAIIDNALEESLTDLRSDLHVTISSIDRRPDGTIILQANIPGTRSIDDIHELLERPARLEIKQVRYPAGLYDASDWMPPPSRDGLIAMFGGRLPAGTELVAESKASGFTLIWPVESISVVVGRDLLDARPMTDDFGSPCISFRLNQEAGRRLQAATTRMIGRHMALILRDDGGARAVAVPVIRAVIGTEGVIEGGFTASQADSLAKRMRAGARAMSLRVVETDGGR
jgi:preprotein translocase subunit SecD